MSPPEKKVMHFFGKSKAALPRRNGSIKNLKKIERFELFMLLIT
jgi:hypothetical protein